jgi:glycogen operon protein
VRIEPGHPSPLGATWDGTGVNFALWSSVATRVELCLFDSPGHQAESRRAFLPGRTGDIWHGYVPDLRPGQLYGYRVAGPWEPEQGHRCNSAELLFDPYARSIGRPHTWEPLRAPLAAVVDDRFDWGQDRAPLTPLQDSVIYELHVKGFTALHPDLPPADRGTYRGLATGPAIDHLRQLGVTAVELMPVHARADERFLHRRGLTNYWGYNTLGFFAPDPRLAAASGDPLGVVREFKTMVKALHAAGLEVILDVVFNHTAEGDHLGPTLSMRGIDNARYYRLQPGNRALYQDFTGCGNTLDTRSPVVRQLILDSLRYWVEEMHVDGFRFDLASALVRGESAVELPSPLLENISSDPVLSRIKLIAEPWDATGEGYLVGRFPAGWSEWNGLYRDTVRRFWRGDAGQRAALATRLAGSSDLYGGNRSPQASVNFITAHDGFTLADLVSYERKHNEANGEENLDGESHNGSANWGTEGATTDHDILARRSRVARSLILTLVVSQGVPMLGGGDESGRTQLGNNNAYCHDSPLSWTPWPGDQDLLSFTRRALALRRAHPQLRRTAFFNGGTAGQADVTWLGPSGLALTDADWQDADARAFGMWLRERDHRQTSLLVLLNPGEQDVDFSLPASNGTSWTLALSSGDRTARSDLASPFRLAGQSVAVLLCK